MSTQDSRPKPFETASATTDADNANSGPFAYIITGVAVAGLLVFGVICSGIASIALTAASSAASGSAYGNYPDTPFSDDEFDFDQFERWLDQYDVDGSGSGYDTGDGSSSQSDSSVATVAEVLDFDLAPYQNSINDEVSARAYAGTPSEVRDFVRELINTDTDYTKQVVAALNGAALDEDTRTDKVKEAVSLCAEASRAIGKVSVPTLDKDTDGTVADLLGSAQTKAQERWDQMGRELGLLDTTEQVQTRKLWNYDGDVVDATQEAGDLLEDAMEEAADL